MLSGTIRRSMYMCLITILSPSNSIDEAAFAFSSSTSSGAKRSRGSATSEYSSVSAMRPTRS